MLHLYAALAEKERRLIVRRSCRPASIQAVSERVAAQVAGMLDDEPNLCAGVRVHIRMFTVNIAAVELR